MYAIRCTFENESKFYATTNALWSGEKNSPVIVGTKSEALSFESESEATIKADSLARMFPDTAYKVVEVTSSDRLSWKTVF